jgi:hypothetical protein
MRPVDVAGIGREGTGTFDMGAYEFQNLRGDLHLDGLLDPLDLFVFSRDWMKATQ